MTKRADHITLCSVLSRALRWLTVCQRIVVYKALHGSGPKYISDHRVRTKQRLVCLHHISGIIFRDMWGLHRRPLKSGLKTFQFAADLDFKWMYLHQILNFYFIFNSFFLYFIHFLFYYAIMIFLLDVFICDVLLVKHVEWPGVWKVLNAYLNTLLKPVTWYSLATHKHILIQLQPPCLSVYACEWVSECVSVCKRCQ